MNMRIETDRLIIRDLEKKDKEQIFKIVWQKEVIRFMKDWSENIERKDDRKHENSKRL